MRLPRGRDRAHWPRRSQGERCSLYVSSSSSEPGPKPSSLRPSRCELVRRRVPVHLYLDRPASRARPRRSWPRRGCRRRGSAAPGGAIRSTMSTTSRARSSAAGARARPSWSIVQGDTSSALGGARAAHALRPAARACRGGPAQLRPRARRGPRSNSGSRSTAWPTCCSRRPRPPPPTFAAKAATGTLHVTGNSGIDALFAQLDRMPRHRRRGAARGPLKLLVTCHRRENWGTGLVSLSLALIALARRGEVAIDVVLHPNPQVAQAMFALAQRRTARPPRRPARPRRDDRRDAPRRPHPERFGRGAGGSPGARRAAARPARHDRAARRRRVGQCPAGRDRHRARRRRGVAGSSPTAPRCAAMATPRFPFGDGQSAPRIAALALAWLDAQAEDRRRVLSA